MAQLRSSKTRAFFRAGVSGAFDQYLQDIQKLPLIKDREEEQRVARLAQKGDPVAAERLVTANLRFVISYVKKYQGHGLDLSELVAIGAAIAANCEPCLRYHVKAATELGVTSADITRAVEMSAKVKDVPHRAVLKLAALLVGQSDGL